MTNKLVLAFLSVALLVTVVGCSEASKLQNNPSDIAVQTAVKKLDGVMNTCLVTEANDANNLINKPGSYTGAVYFRLKQVDEVISKCVYYQPYSEDACEAQFEGGGKIEIFANAKDANKRNDYLGTFDDTLYAGYHSVRETVVIRLSSNLTFKQQQVIEEQIYNLLLNTIQK